MKTRQRKLSISKPVIEFLYRERGDLCWKRVEGPGSEKSIDSMLFNSWIARMRKSEL